VIRQCSVIAIEGTHASGKTSVVHGLTAHYRERGVHVACVGDPARTSPLIEDVVLHGLGAFDLAAEVDLFATQISEQIRAARHHRLLVTDKTIANVLAYAGLLLDSGARADPSISRVLGAMTRMCEAWRPYDAVFLCIDQFAPEQRGDPYRGKVRGLQAPVEDAVRDVCESLAYPTHELPRRMDTNERVTWVAERVRQLRLLDDR